MAGTRWGFVRACLHRRYAACDRRHVAWLRTTEETTLKRQKKIGYCTAQYAVPSPQFLSICVSLVQQRLVFLKHSGGPPGVHLSESGAPDTAVAILYFQREGDWMQQQRDMVGSV